MKRAFTLFELLIALALCGVLVASLMNLLFQGSKPAKSSLWDAIEEYSCRQRLNRVLPEILTPPKVEGGALIFTFNNGIDDDPHFCGEVESRLFVNDKKQLILTLSPLSTWKGEFAPREEILLANLPTIDFRFYEIPGPTQLGRWEREWDQEDLPALIECGYLDSKKIYPLINANKPPTYYKQ